MRWGLRVENEGDSNFFLNLNGSICSCCNVGVASDTVSMLSRPRQLEERLNMLNSSKEGLYFVSRLQVSIRIQITKSESQLPGTQYFDLQL